MRAQGGKLTGRGLWQDVGGREAVAGNSAVSAAGTALLQQALSLLQVTKHMGFD